MNNLFENAYFGKPYKTRDGRKALYYAKDTLHFLIVEGTWNFLAYLNDGIIWDIDGSEKYDIISEWTISEEKLDKLAEYYLYGENSRCMSPREIYELASPQDKDTWDAYKAGLRAKEAMV